MFARFFPAGRVSAYRSSPHKERIDHVAAALICLRYDDVVVSQYLREWLRFTTDLDNHGLALPTDVRDPEVDAYVDRRLPGGSASRLRGIRAAVRIYLEADAAGSFRRRISTAPRAPIATWFVPLVEAYLHFADRHRGLSARTLQKRQWELERFSAFLVKAHVSDLSEIGTGHIRDFLLSLEGLSSATRRAYCVTLRSFLRWAFQQGHVAADLCAAVRSGRHYRQATVRDVLSEQEIARILAATERNSRSGRRDYAVLMLAARYGLRPSDICQLRLDDLDWRAGVLALRQAKTGCPLRLPLLPDVASALIDYLRDGRPTTQERRVFVRHRAPFEPFVPANNLSAIMRSALRRAGLDQRSGRRGIYLFRHSLATRLLAAQCPIKVIGDLLGHSCTDSTREYATVDLAGLRRVALSEAEVGL